MSPLRRESHQPNKVIPAVLEEEQPDFRAWGWVG